MCIRDSAWITRIDRRPQILGDVREIKIEEPVVEIRPPVVVCLLYTSDAADERSSVDLGGRRIIKKKKQTKSERVKMMNKEGQTRGQLEAQTKKLRRKGI